MSRSVAHFFGQSGRERAEVTRSTPSYVSLQALQPESGVLSESAARFDAGRRVRYAASVRDVFLVLGFGSCLLLPRPAHADSTKQACVQAYVDAQRLRKADKLTEARQKLELCADQACPASIKKDCGPWLEENLRDQPSIALVAKDLAGEKTVDVQVFVDDVKVGDQIPNTPFKLDPGTHKVRFEAKGLEPVQIEVTLQKGEQGREVLADFSKQKKADPTPAPSSAAVQADTGSVRPTPALVYVLGGVGVLGLGSFAYFGSTGKSEENDLADSCAPRCDPSKVDSAHRKMLIADISLGVSAVAFGAAAYLYFTRPKAKENSAWVGVGPMRDGAGAFVRGSF